MQPTPFPFRISTLFVAWVLAGLPTPVSREDADNAGSIRVTVLTTPDGGIQPQAVIDALGVIHLIYFKGKPSAGDLFYVRREPGEEGFTEPVRVNSQPGSAIAVGTIRGGSRPGQGRPGSCRLERLGVARRRTPRAAHPCSTRGPTRAGPPSSPSGT